MQSPRVTVIIPTYNWSTVLPYSVGSALAQTLGDIEVLVIGDGCTDDSAEVVAAIGDPRVRWINLPENTGHQSGPNNRGLAEARGEFIAYLGHDDLWLPHHLQGAVDALERSGAALAYTMVGWVPPGADVAAPLVPRPEAGAWSPPSGTVHRRALTDKLGGWRDYRALRVTPETELWRRAASAGFPFVFVPRLGALKFSAALRAGVYRERPCHEQAAWWQRIRSEPQLEACQLALMMLKDPLVRSMPGRTLVRLVATELFRRVRYRFSRRSGLIAGYLPKRGTNIDAVRIFKGLQ